MKRAIGHLKGRFRRLRDLYCHNIQHVCEIIMSACVLHNLCILCSDDVDAFFDNDTATNAQVNNYPLVYGNNAAGVNKRNQLVQYLQQHV